MDVGDILRGVLTCVRRHSVRVDVEYATLILNILCLDSMGKVTLKSGVPSVGEGIWPVATHFHSYIVASTASIKMVRFWAVRCHTMQPTSFCT